VLTENLPPRRLLKGVPGIPQGSRLFNEAFAAHLQTMGWRASAADKCLFLNPDLAELTAVIIWVDDFIFMCEHESTWQSFLTAVRQRFNVPTAGDLVTFLGMDIQFEPAARTMFISQTNSVNTLLERAKMADCNPVTTPCQTGIVWTKKDCPDKQESADNCTQYRALVALANFIANWTRPDITFAVNKLCKFMSNPGPAHWQALKHLIRYLQGTKRDGLSYNFAESKVPGLHGFTDASYADCPDTGKSTIGYAFFYGGAVLSWFSKLHTYVTTCTNITPSMLLLLLAPKKLSGWCICLKNWSPKSSTLQFLSSWTMLASFPLCSTLSTISQTNMSACPATMPVS